MDNKQDRQFYWEVKDFMGKTPQNSSSEPRSVPSLVENVKSVLSKNEIYKPSTFNPSIGGANVIRQAIGAMERSRQAGMSSNPGSAPNIHSNVFGMIKESIANQQFNESVVTPPFWSGEEFAKEFTTAPTAKSVIQAAVSPAKTAKAAYSAVEWSAKNPGAATMTVAKTLGPAIVAGGIAVPVGSLVRYGAEAAMEKAGMEKPSVPFIEKPNAAEIIASAADWGAMSAAATSAVNAMTGVPLTAGLGTTTAIGIAGGALVPWAAYGGYKAGEALRDVEAPSWMGGEVSDKAGKMRSKTYKEIGSDVVDYYSDEGPYENPSKTRGMPSQKKPKTKEDYPNLEEIQKNTKFERERQQFVPSYISSPI
jgi:hypothetical protein